MYSNIQDCDEGQPDALVSTAFCGTHLLNHQFTSSIDSIQFFRTPSLFHVQQRISDMGTLTGARYPFVGLYPTTLAPGPSGSVRSEDPKGSSALSELPLSCKHPRANKSPTALDMLFVCQVQRAAFFVLRISLGIICSVCEASFYRAVADHINERVGRYCLMMLLGSCGMWNAGGCESSR
jgi:hypothetical protein